MALAAHSSHHFLCYAKHMDANRGSTDVSASYLFDAPFPVLGTFQSHPLYVEACFASSVAVCAALVFKSWNPLSL
jgi:hypothetical protein